MAVAAVCARGRPNSMTVPPPHGLISGGAATANKSLGTGTLTHRLGYRRRCSRSPNAPPSSTPGLRPVSLHFKKRFGRRASTCHRRGPQHGDKRGRRICVRTRDYGGVRTCASWNWLTKGECLRPGRPRPCCHQCAARGRAHDRFLTNVTISRPIGSAHFGVITTRAWIATVLLTTHHGVGSEGWSSDSFTRRD